MSGTAFEIGVYIELQTAVLRALPRTMSKSDMLAWAGNGDRLERALASALCPLATPMPQPVADTIIRVDRSIRPVYPDWVKEVMHLELEATGPSEYDITTIVDNLWLHNGQKNGKWVKGTVVYDYLKNNNMIESCLDLRDLEEIRKKGIDFFRKHFAGKAIFAWKSVVQDRGGYLFVPYLLEHRGGVVVFWHWLGPAWHGDSPAARFAS